MSVAPKRPKGPPLNALRAFEAAARHVSFVAAAEELNVTPGAISQHIKTLEGWSGTSLFRREAQGVELTKAGAVLLPKLSAAFDGLADATQTLRNLGSDREFHIAALPAVAQLWLPKRLAKIRALFPEIRFSVTAMEAPPRLKRHLFDFAIFIGEPNETSDQIRICADRIAPVCAPSLLGTAANFSQATLLHDQTWSDDWVIWCKSAGVTIEYPRNGAQFSLYSLAVEEAKAGAGMLMGHLSLIADALAANDLVMADDRVCDTGRYLLLDLPPSALRRAETRPIVEMLSK